MPVKYELTPEGEAQKVCTDRIIVLRTAKQKDLAYLYNEVFTGKQKDRYIIAVEQKETKTTK